MKKTWIILIMGLLCFCPGAMPKASAADIEDIQADVEDLNEKVMDLRDQLGEIEELRERVDTLQREVDGLKKQHLPEPKRKSIQQKIVRE